MTRLRKMNRQVIRTTDSVHVGVLTASSHNYTRVGHPQCIQGLHSGNALQDILVGENPDMAKTFSNQFLKVHDNYPATDFRAPGWIHPPKGWWKNLTQYILVYFREDLERLRLHEAARATCYDIHVSIANFYAILELYCPSTRTFFTLMDELGMTLHEIWEVSAFPMGSLPYEEYFPCEAELALLEKQEPTLFETYKELMCHFYIVWMCMIASRKTRTV